MIGVVTSAWGDYGKYLPEWAESLANQTVRPAQAVIVDAGCTDAEGVARAVQILNEAGIPAKTGKVEYTTLGAARNAATALCDAEWVSHLDADDLFLTNAVADIAELTDNHDVIAFGCIRDGRPITFPEATAEMILNRQVCVYSCGAFRKSLWEQRPWHTLNDWCDSTYWVGLAHLGARFASTGKVGFVYRQHGDSVSHTISPADKQFAIDQWLSSIEHWQF
ncbi:glycosyltransferase [Mycobacterium phage Dallas]|nr:glycosyltransferase [Mycobacterium phage Dallas]